MSRTKNIEYKTVNIIGSDVSLLDLRQAITLTDDMIKHNILDRVVRKNFNTSYICLANARSLILSKKIGSMRAALQHADLAIACGKIIPRSILLRKFIRAPKIRRSDLLLEFCKHSTGRYYSHFFYGGSQKTLENLIANLKKRNPDIIVDGVYAPPERLIGEVENKNVIDIINNEKPDILWVGLGSPKQEIWMYNHKDLLKVPMVIGVGSVFNLIAALDIKAGGKLRSAKKYRLPDNKRRFFRNINTAVVFIYYLLTDLFMPKRHKKGMPTGS